MVCIAVRTLTLNIYKVNYLIIILIFKCFDESMNKFLLPKSEFYFKKVAKDMAVHVIEMDIFARSAQNENSNRERLITMIDKHLDQMHYVNDILMIKHIELVTVFNYLTLNFSEFSFNEQFIYLYIWAIISFIISRFAFSFNDFAFKSLSIFSFMSFFNNNT